jgi:bla regulator protein blaR1
MTRSLLIAGALAAATVFSAAGPFAQQTDTQSPAPTFEAASVKPNKSGDGNNFISRQPGGRFGATNMPLRALITFAYQLQPLQLVGGPNWIANDRFDIVAKMEGDPPPVLPGSGPDAMMLALRTLLADRFNLIVHRETRELDVYALVMAKPGSKPGPVLKPSTLDCSPQARRGGPPPAPPGPTDTFCGLRISPGRVQLGGFPLSPFANALQGLAGRIVIDRSGLTGTWEGTLTYAPDGRGGLPGGPPPGAQLPVDSDAPNLFTALQEQFGLKLESTKAPVDVLVIDSVQQPTPD